MANLKPTLKNDFIKESGKANIKIHVSHDGKTRYIKTSFDILPKYMNKDGTISGKCPGHTKLNISIGLLLAEYNSTLLDIKNINDVDINTIVETLRRNEPAGNSFTKYMEERIKTLRSEKRIKNAAIYSATLSHVETFTGKTDILFKEISLDFFNRLEGYLLSKEKRVNTIRIYLNAIKAVLYHVSDNGIVKIDLSFLRKFKVKSEPTEKRNLSPEQFRLLSSQKLSPQRQRALDLFMLSFFLLGANFKDMLYFTPAHAKKNRVNYLRYKTKKKKPVMMSVKIVPEAQALFDKYKGEKYLLKFIEEKNFQRKTEPHDDIIKNTNVLLKKICKQVKMEIPYKFGTYYARGSVATLAYKLGIMESTISEMLGHSAGNEMTNTYIERDTTKIDAAQRLIIDSLA